MYIYIYVYTRAGSPPSPEEETDSRCARKFTTSQLNTRYAAEMQIDQNNHAVGGDHHPAHFPDPSKKKTA